MFKVQLHVSIITGFNLFSKKLIIRLFGFVKQSPLNNILLTSIIKRKMQEIEQLFENVTLVNFALTLNIGIRLYS